jgi:hypothetical protein
MTSGSKSLVCYLWWFYLCGCPLTLYWASSHSLINPFPMELRSDRRRKIGRKMTVNSLHPLSLNSKAGYLPCWPDWGLSELQTIPRFSQRVTRMSKVLPTQRTLHRVHTLEAIASLSTTAKSHSEWSIEKEWWIVQTTEMSMPKAQEGELNEYLQSCLHGRCPRC